MNCRTSRSSVLHCNLKYSQIMFIESMMLRELILGILIRSPEPLRRRKESRDLKEEKATDFFLFFLHCFVLVTRDSFFSFLELLSCYGNNIFILRLTFFKHRASDYITKQCFSRVFSLKLCTNDCITTMYHV